MDFLVKNNIIKKTKVLVDIGHKYIKLVGVKYENNQAAILCYRKVESTSILIDQDFSNSVELVKLVANFIITNRLKSCEVCLALPTDLVLSKIIEVRNVQEKEIGKHIQEEHHNFNRVSSLTHIIDWAYGGKSEKNGDTIHYCLLCAVAKSVIMPILSEFEKRNLKVSAVSSTFNNFINFADLFANDYENLNKVFIDFGEASTRTVVYIEGVPVYCREFEMGFGTLVDSLFKATGIDIPELIKSFESKKFKENETYQEAFDKFSFLFAHEIERVVEMFEDETVSFTKIIWSGKLFDQFKEALSRGGYISVEEFNLSDVDSMSGTDYIIYAQTAQLDSSYNSLVGLAVNTYR